ncbi:hypothetical protein GE061_006868 [Apolygus lucorum]|uniref:JmjC domain-containing histone demethylation protein 2C n=1 Tax=Apolygus lucorum TaxID=248454 RepID=A0A8S9WTX2_APOLU|nr:hypothetical protein GE061_006868 [Apolygus lucorum]
MEERMKVPFGLVTLDVVQSVFCPIGVLVEYDDREWQRREWVCVHKVGIFQVFLVEKTLIWTSRSETHRAPSGALAPALTFMPLVGSSELSVFGVEAIEFLRDRHVAFRDPSNFKHIQDYERRWGKDPAVAEWSRSQDGQSILLATPSVLVGYRVQVYRSEGTTQWYTAVIVGYNEGTRELTVTDDTVLEDHNEDPCLVQMRLIGDGVIESIMRGENVGITPRRSRSNLVLHHRPPNRGKKAIKTPKKLNRRTTVSGPAGAKPPAQPPDRGKRSPRLPREPSSLVSNEEEDDIDTNV